MGDRILKSMRSMTVCFVSIVGVIGCDSFEPIGSSGVTKRSDSDLSGRRGEIAEVSKEDFLRWSDPNYGKKQELRFLRAPKLRDLEIPISPGMNSIWGATGRDHLGRIYFGVSAWDGGQDPSAMLWRYDPRAESFESLGDVNSKLSELGVRRSDPIPETQMKIHSKIVQASDGKMYFSTQDEHNEKEDGTSNALFGGRIFSFDPRDHRWECVHTAPEGLIAIAARGPYVVSQGYFGHVLYQYNVETKEIRTIRLGTFQGHVSRNIFMDRRMHVYGIRAKIAESEEGEGLYQVGNHRVRVTLVELDDQLEEVQEWPLEDYLITGSTSSHGITGFCELIDGDIVFVTQTGALWRIELKEDRSELLRLGWIGADGQSSCGGLFAPFGDRFVCGFTIQREGEPYTWNVFDIEERRSNSFKLDVESELLLKRPELLAYGTETIDHQSRAYVVGWRQSLGGKVPHVMQLSWE